MRSVVRTVEYASGGFFGRRSTTSDTVAAPFSHSTSISFNSASVRLGDFLRATGLSSSIKELIVQLYIGEGSLSIKILATNGHECTRIKPNCFIRVHSCPFVAQNRS